MTVTSILASPSSGGLAQPMAGNNGKRLTRQQARIVIYLACGCSVEDIAHALCISPSTVERHIEAAAGRLRVHGRTALVALSIVTANIRIDDLCDELRRVRTEAGEGADPC